MPQTHPNPDAEIDAYLSTRRLLQDGVEPEVGGLVPQQRTGDHDIIRSVREQHGDNPSVGAAILVAYVRHEQERTKE